MIYKEHICKSRKMDVWYFNAWIALFQFLFGLCTFPMIFDKFLAGGNSIDPSDLPDYVENSFRCFVGSNSIANDACEETPFVFIVYLIVNLIFNVSLLSVFKYGSATLASIAGSVRVALSAFAFNFSFVAGVKKQKSLTWFDYVGVIIVIFGLIVYRMRNESKRSNQADQLPNTLNEENALNDPLTHDPDLSSGVVGYSQIVGDKSSESETNWGGF
eukprot:TRINITY_DN3909_c0_g1_i1.p1 TRINITY_DN3909_c0_g1~~TRINITY_DN3909_c0_g1_i1.p1  ORF type:complete len:216 (+),score=30.45 TRINITY_DN3909_c0_g1_i1:469-1116(+)